MQNTLYISMCLILNVSSSEYEYNIAISKYFALLEYVYCNDNVEKKACTFNYNPILIISYYLPIKKININAKRKKQQHNSFVPTSKSRGGWIDTTMLSTAEVVNVGGIIMLFTSWSGILTAEMALV